jgi:hypothetical protein
MTFRTNTTIFISRKELKAAAKYDYWTNGHKS